MNLIDARSLEELKNLYEFTKYKSDDLVKKNRYEYCYFATVNYFWRKYAKLILKINNTDLVLFNLYKINREKGIVDLCNIFFKN
jgi:hypothetical protein